MLKIKTQKKEFWDEKTQEFVYSEGCEFRLEHSLLSISKWEAKYHKPFFSKEEKTDEETLYYIKCMILDDDIDIESINTIHIFGNEELSEINAYINDSQTATWFSDNKKNKKSKSPEQVTNELVYYWMIALGIPFECEKWHFNRLLTLIEVCNIKNEKPKNMSKKELYSRNTALNQLRRKQMNTHG